MSDYLFGGNGSWGRLLLLGVAGVLCWAISLGGEARGQWAPESRAPSAAPDRAPPVHQAPSTGRSQGPGRSQGADRSERSGGPTGGEVPSWAEPRSGSASSQGRLEPSIPSAQPRNPGGGLPGDGEIPLGGLEWLLAAGAGYGFWKLRDEE